MKEQEFATKYRQQVRDQLRNIGTIAAVIEYKVCKHNKFNFSNFQPAQRAVFNSILAGKDVYHKIEDAGMSSRFVDGIYFATGSLPVLVVWYDKTKEARMYLLTEEMMEEGEVNHNQGISL